MKKLIYLIILASFAMVSCSDEFGQMNGHGEDGIVLNIYNSPLTKAIGDTKGESYERRIERLDCFFYEKRQTDQPCVYYQQVTLDKDGYTRVVFNVDESVINTIFPTESTCDIFIIANLNDEIFDDAAFAQNQDGTYPDATKLTELEKIVLTKSADYDAPQKSFVMTGFAEGEKQSTRNAEATVPLVRAAAKITLSLSIPKEISLKEGSETHVYKPILTDMDGNSTMVAKLNNSWTKGYIRGDQYTETDRTFFSDQPLEFDAVTEDQDSIYVKYKVPLYTYARDWSKSSNDAAFWTFQLQWGYDSTGDGELDKYGPYYYQFLINGPGLCFKANHWYDMSVKLGVLGGTVDNDPRLIGDMTYYVIDWTEESTSSTSGDRLEDVVIKDYKYLEVPQTYIEMNNVSTTSIRYTASHKIGVEFDTKGNKTVEGLPEVTNLSALYIDNSTGKPEAEMIENIYFKNEGQNKSNFIDDGKGTLTFNYVLNPNDNDPTNDIYSPAYLFVTIWLDVDGDGVHDLDEILTQDVTIVMYPAIYIIGDNSYKYSIFINGNYNSNRLGGGSLSYLTIDGKRVGKAAGDDSNTYMHIISISAFNEQNYKFAYNNNKNKDTEYIIGDPRVRSSYKLGVPDDDTTVKQDAYGWIKATDVNGTVRNLQYYYPTSDATEANSYQVIAPKFRIASKLGGYSECHPEGAALRCASYQEHGFPAGRWRLPTTAEILYIIELQRLNKIQQLFYGGNTYFSATDRVKANSDNTYTLSTGIGTSNASVRCVYDDWFWGSEREAIANSSLSQNGGYQFTWGDRFIY